MKLNLAGQRFGRLIVIGKAGMSKTQTVYKCVCDCGNIEHTTAAQLRSGNVKSCGCYQRECSSKRILRRIKDGENHISYKHGHASHKRGYSLTYLSWAHMIQRCKNPKATGYMNYGGRGIRVCERWLVFENFLEDMGERPEGTSIDRKNNDGNYEKSNCKWSTIKEQRHNQRPAKLTKEQVRYIRTSGKSTRELARELSVTITNINMIKAHTSWKSI